MTESSPPGAPACRSAPGDPLARRAVWGVVWLAYLGLYPVPWIWERPSTTAMSTSAIAIAAFMVVYLHAMFARPTRRLPHIVAITLIGFALVRCGGAWSVFTIYAASLAGGLQPRRAALRVLAAIGASTIGVVAALHLYWEHAASGLFFGALAAAGALLRAEIEDKNRRLFAAQGEVHRLAVSAERERISRDLHDLLGHTLTLVAVKADLAARLAEHDAGRAKREMEDVAAVARDALGEVRTAVAGMRGASLAAEVDRATRMLVAAGVDAQVRIEPINDPNREAILAMALREAVTNVIRHAQASCCTIGLDAPARGEARLCVFDDGSGGAIQEGAGLGGMRAPRGGGRNARHRGGGSRYAPDRAAAGARAVIRVVIAEDQALVLGALAALLDLEADIEVVGCAPDGPSALALVAALAPDVVVSDIEMPGLSGLDVAAQLRTTRSAARVIIVTTFGRAGYLRRALEAGVRGYLLKDAPSTVLAQAVRVVAAGGRAIDPLLADAAWDAPSDPLNERERAALRLAEEGRSNREIGATLSLAPGTVRNYLSEAAHKLGASNRVEAGRIARTNGWL